MAGERQYLYGYLVSNINSLEFFFMNCLDGMYFIRLD